MLQYRGDGMRRSGISSILNEIKNKQTIINVETVMECNDMKTCS